MDTSENTAALLHAVQHFFEHYKDLEPGNG
jgi:inorganic pyrophosphatase